VREIMKDLVRKKSKYLDISTVLEAVKERLVEHRFNIDNYDIPTGSIDGRRNNLDKVVLGLYRKVSVRAEMNKDEITLDIKWGGLISSCSVSALQFFFISLAIFRSFEAQGIFISALIGALGIFLNLMFFFGMRARIISRIRRDLHDLEIAMKDKKGKKTVLGRL
jgi:hypothetical protein